MGRVNRRAARTDDNQKAIVEELRSHPGVKVMPGMDDILVGYKGKTFWYEVKNPNAISKRTGELLCSKVKAGQKVLAEEWTGHYKLVTTVEEILAELWGDI
jgi:hypothetical protein